MTKQQVEQALDAIHAEADAMVEAGADTLDVAIFETDALETLRENVGADLYDEVVAERVARGI